MTKVYLSCFFLLFFLACNKPQEPVFKKVANIKVEMISTSQIRITGDAIYHNPNQIGGLLTKTEVQVEANDIEVADIKQILDTPIPAQGDFSLPLSFVTSPKEIFEKDKGGIIGSVINALSNRKIDLYYKGSATIHFAGIPYRVPIDYQEEVSLAK